MDLASLSQSPFTVVTFIVAPAMLTNASSVLAMSTINRMLRTRDRMAELYHLSEKGGQSPDEAKRQLELVDRVEEQAILLLQALRAIYLALGSFVGATLVTLIGAVFEHSHAPMGSRVSTIIGLAMGAVGVAGLMTGCVHLFQATRISLRNISAEAALIRARHAERQRLEVHGEC